jgi:hypothetical protein
LCPMLVAPVVTGPFAARCRRTTHAKATVAIIKRHTEPMTVPTMTPTERGVSDVERPSAPADCCAFSPKVLPPGITVMLMLVAGEAEETLLEGKKPIEAIAVTDKRADALDMGKERLPVSVRLAATAEYVLDMLLVRVSETRSGGVGIVPACDGDAVLAWLVVCVIEHVADELDVDDAVAAADGVRPVVTDWLGVAVGLGV